MKNSRQIRSKQKIFQQRIFFVAVNFGYRTPHPERTSASKSFLPQRKNLRLPKNPASGGFIRFQQGRFTRPAQ
jgi:hypothetical protein